MKRFTCNYTATLCSIQKQLERAMDGPIDVVKLYQQQEDMKFLSHFGGKCIIHWVSVYLHVHVYTCTYWYQSQSLANVHVHTIQFILFH